MAIRSPELLNRLPSVSELLDKPPIRALADRWNRTMVAGGVRSFLEELRHETRRRTADLPVPSIRELAERAARYVVAQQQSSLGVAINATGRLWGAAWSQLPLSEAALERAVAVGREFVVEPSLADRPSSDVERLLCRLTGGEAAVAVHSYTGAVWLSLAAMAGGREVLASRAEIGCVGSADPLPKLAAAAAVVLKEIGTTHRATTAEYEAAASERTAAILKLGADEYCVIGDTATAELDELVALAKNHQWVVIDALGAAPLVDHELGTVPAWPRRSLAGSIAAGAQLAVVRGDGLVGGPPCGIIAGSRDALRRVTDHPMYAAWRLDALRSAALLATLECYETTSPGEAGCALPVWQLLTAPVQNLRNRAERMAPQLTQADGIAAAAAIETRSQLSAALAADGGWPSFGVALTPGDGDMAALARRLRGAALPVVGRIDRDQLVLDLRTVLPRQDRLIVETLLGSDGRAAAQVPQID